MGRIFEVRKATMFARWDKMAKQFTRIGKEIVIAVKAGGPMLPPTRPAPLFPECQKRRHA
jgi:transcriptional/translational regulatory protein YebC/TACO1